MSGFINYQQPDGQWAKIAATIDGNGVATPKVALDGAPFSGGYRPSGWIATSPLNAQGTPNIDEILVYPFAWFGGSINGLAGRVTVAGTASGTKAAVWRHDYTTGRPGGLPLVFDNVGIDTTTIGTKTFSVTPVSVPDPTLLWVGSLSNGAPLPTMQAVIAAHTYLATMTTLPSVGEILRGAANNGLHGFSVAAAFATNIATFNMTGRTFTVVGGSAGVIPNLVINASNP